MSWFCFVIRWHYDQNFLKVKNIITGKVFVNAMISCINLNPCFANVPITSLHPYLKKFTEKIHLLEIVIF